MQSGEVHLAKYMNIAADIADRIVRGEYQEGQKIFGRSTLAGKYNVSPETIRRALILLQEAGIVQVTPGVGVAVKSLDAAQKYLEDFGQRRVLQGLHEQLYDLVKKRDQLNEEISKLIEELMEHTLQVESRFNKIEEWKVLPESPLVGKYLSQLELCDQSRVLTIQRKDVGEIVNPTSKNVIEGGDIITIFGTLSASCKKGLVRV
ncbi:winged helix-turn-helix domain-containing protein [Desulforamulus ruminis]|uniref:Regulatory protein GntR HTH n=1 Tax=Desulforamulus ruminis (strain ATCC 23193 / DSM 2154 / NCIMB 8452 / DL) TaxID=696281 RepID=F6DSC2_DESRL|nr:GntR family transcriptional regulator [Desulforamulus ruminis]AEG59901.1 regulatory protein GntR HTH [Desulforamulus ruminis DSM 2154]